MSELITMLEPEQIDAMKAKARLDGERTGYVKALDDVIENGVAHRDIFNTDLFIGMVYNMKTDYQKEVEDGANP